MTTQPEEIFRLAIEACPVGILMADAAGTITLINTEIERQFGYARAEILGKPVELLLPQGLRAQHARHHADFAEAPAKRHMGSGLALSGLRKNGTELPIDIALNPIATPQGIFVLAVIIDLSEKKRIERLKDEFVATVSHELRTPLTSISGALGLLIANSNGTLTASVARLLNIAHSNSQRLVRLVNAILDMEKLESGKVIFKVRRIDVCSLIEQTIEANREIADGTRVNIELKAPAKPTEMRADPDWLAQVITNLLSNAIKFSPPGGVVEVAVEQQQRTVRITVRDHGHGVPNDFKPYVFERFAQADATDARQMGGTGLGLTIVKQIVTRLGGTVGFDDAPGGGALFFVELPNWDTAGQLAFRPTQPGIAP
jgi:PAS domain S-box-containing protein